MDIIIVSDMLLHSAKRRTARVNMGDEDEEHGEGRILSSTPNRAVLSSQKGRPTSPFLQNLIHQGHATPAGVLIHFPYTSDLTAFDSHLSNPNFKFCALV